MKSAWRGHTISVGTVLIFEKKASWGTLQWNEKFIDTVMG